ncbi:TPA: hypothetical protein R9Y59_000165 [Stenotrophomonas maltophilia]|nr:hypothetical protein [Stenotrophomonas maltophilia]HEF1870135.1 hypothetical protein [Stenotrophomonas maltophilia]HEF1890505.1 hypothetical protein [Stenotrophomonas maltophilia]
MRTVICFCIATAFLSLSAHAKPSLGCQDAIKEAKHRQIVWNSASQDLPATEHVDTSAGRLELAAGKDGFTALSLNGKPVQVPSSAAGTLAYGQVYDLGKQILVAAFVERPGDSSAVPSEVQLLLSGDGSVLDSAVHSGTAPSKDFCSRAEG